jgi:hypothetical protein
MFLGGWKLPRDACGRVFIDRDGRVFRLVLYVLEGTEPTAEALVAKLGIGARVDMRLLREELEWCGLDAFVGLRADLSSGASSDDEGEKPYNPDTDSSEGDDDALFVAATTGDRITGW